MSSLRYAFSYLQSKLITISAAIVIAEAFINHFGFARIKRKKNAALNLTLIESCLLYQKLAVWVI